MILLMLPRAVLLFLTAALALTLAADGCGSGVTTTEWGAECTDGKDNDGDGLLDCADPDCRTNPLCGGIVDRGVDLRRDGAPAPDLRRSDLPVQSGYGTRCTSVGGSCPDGSVCVPSPSASKGVGFCSKPCSNPGGDCPAGPSGTFAACVYSVNGEYHCAFLCSFKGVDHPCLSGFNCVPDQQLPTQKYCWP